MNFDGHVPSSSSHRRDFYSKKPPFFIGKTGTFRNSSIFIIALATVAALSAFGQEGAAQDVKQGAKKTGQAIKNGLETAGEKTKEAAKTVGQKTKETAKTVGRKAKETAEDIGGKTKESTRSVHKKPRGASSKTKAETNEQSTNQAPNTPSPNDR